MTEYVGPDVEDPHAPGGPLDTTVHDISSLPSAGLPEDGDAALAEAWAAMDPIDRVEAKVDHLTSVVEGFVTQVQTALQQLGPAMEQLGPVLGMLGIK